MFWSRADGGPRRWGSRKIDFSNFQKFSKKKSGPNLAVLAPEKDSSEDLGAHRPKIIQKYALAAIFWTKRKF